MRLDRLNCTVKTVAHPALRMNVTDADANDRRARRFAWPLSIGLIALLTAPHAIWTFREACLASALLSVALGIALGVLLRPANPDAPRRIGLRAGFGAYAALASILAGLALGVFFHLPLGPAFLAFLGVSIRGAVLLILAGIPLAIVAFRRQEDPVES